MSARIQVVVDEAEREAFRLRAVRSGLSLSAWLREAGRRRLKEETTKIRSAQELREFFEGLSDDDRTSPEPDWPEHLRTIEKSRTSGLESP